MAGHVIANELIATAKADDVLDRIVREHARLVYRIAYSLLHNHYDAEDVTQETFVRVLRSRDKLNTLRDPKSWLARIAWRIAIDRIRKKADAQFDDVNADIEQLRDTSAVADEAVLANEMKRLLSRLIGGLPSQLRDVITLSAVGELSPAQIGNVLGIPEAAVRPRLFRARGILNQMLASLLENKNGT